MDFLRWDNWKDRWTCRMFDQWFDSFCIRTFLAPNVKYARYGLVKILREGESEKERNEERDTRVSPIFVVDADLSKPIWIVAKYENLRRASSRLARCYGYHQGHQVCEYRDYDRASTSAFTLSVQIWHKYIARRQSTPRRRDRCSIIGLITLGH